MPALQCRQLKRLGQLMLLVASLLLSAKVAADENEKKQSTAAQILRARGIDPDILSSLNQANALPAGENLLDISVNGELKSSQRVMTGRQGQICFTPDLIDQLGLKQPAQLADPGCIDLSQQPGFNLKADPQKLALSIVVPQQALADEPQYSGEMGGHGALLNYNYYSGVSRVRGRQSRYSYLMLEDGINMANWMLRGRQQLNEDRGKVNINRGTLYAERPVPGWRKRIQFGQIGVSNTLFSLGEIDGIQVIPDRGLEKDSSESGSIEGIAGTSQARVEVRQYGALVFSTLVPAGPFHLNGIPLHNLNGDLDVTVLETDGHQQRFTVPASAMRVNPSGSRGLSIAAGRLNQAGESGSGVPALLTLNQNWQVRRLSLQSGLLLTKMYQSLGASLAGPVLQGAQLAAQIVAANDRQQHTSSMQLSLSGSYSLTSSLSFNASVSKNTPGFVSLATASARLAERYENDNLQYRLSAGWNSPSAGYFSYSYSASSRFGDNGISRYDMLSWSLPFRKAMLSVNVSRNRGNSSNRQLSVNFSLPLGGQNFSSYYRRSGSGGQLGAQIDGALGKNGTYYLSSGRDMQARMQSVQGSVSANLHYTRMALAASMNSEQAGNVSLSGSGGMALVGSHLLFSPQPVGQTFGMIELSERLAGVAVRTPGGTSWTDWRGLALAADIPAWHPAMFDLDTESLPKNSDVGNGHHRLAMARGSVKRIRYNILTSRRVLLTLRLPDGRPVPRGGLVRDDRQNIITTVLDDGTIYLENSPVKGTLEIAINGENRRCRVDYQLNDEGENDAPYQQVSGVCLLLPGGGEPTGAAVRAG